MRALLILIQSNFSAWGHTPNNSSQHLNWSLWNIHYHILLVLIALATIYFLGQKRMETWDRKNKFRLKNKAIYYYSGLLLLFIALLSPIDTMSDVLAWAHMLQHTLILMVAAPLMALAGPNYISQWSLSQKSWQRMKKLRFLLTGLLKVSRFKRPIIAWALYIITLTLWHIPIFYEAALKWEWLHDIQHFLFFVSAYYFWRVLFDPFQATIAPLTGILYCFVASLHGIILGVLMTLSPEAWYGPYLVSAPQYGYDPLHDQQIAGFIMWMPAGISYALAALSLLFKGFKLSSSVYKNQSPSSEKR